MAYIPSNAKWYVATLVVELTIAGDDRNVLHENTVLVRADSPGEAYDRAIELGIEHNQEHVNPSGQAVSTRFRGLAHLLVVHDELEHGAELWFEERIGVSEDEIAQLISEKEQLEVFIPIQPTSGPDYTSRDVIDALKGELDRRGS